MDIRVSEEMKAGDLVCLATAADGELILLRWRYGSEAVGIAARDLAKDEPVEFFPQKSTEDILVKGSVGPGHRNKVALKAACDLKTQDLVCLRHQPGGEIVVDRWAFGEEAVGIAARNIRMNETVEFSDGESTRDIHVKPV